MFTRKMRNNSTLEPKMRETPIKIKMMPNPISKDRMRKIIQTRLRMKTSAKRTEFKPKNAQKEAKVKQGFLNLIDHNKCECPICIEIAISPVVLPCGHAYCLKCFEQNSVSSMRCCLCRSEVNVEDIQSAKMVQNIIDSYILPTSSEGISYWCRKGEFIEWENKRIIDLQNLRIGDNIDVRIQDNHWKRGVISCFLFQSNQYCAEIKYCLNGKIENTTISTSSRRLAPGGFFTRGQYLKYRTINYESKFMESIEIPEIKCDFIDKQRQLSVQESKWSQPLEDQPENNELALQLFEYEMKQWENVFQLD